MLAEGGVWWCPQAFLDDEDLSPVPPASRPKLMQIVEGTERVYELAKKHHVKLAWGTDILFDPKLTERQGAQLAKMTRWFTSSEVLTMATRRNAELCGLSGERNPYPGALGVVEQGALADLLLVDGDPLEDVGLLADPAKNLSAIMKDGVLYKNTLGVSVAGAR